LLRLVRRRCTVPFIFCHRDFEDMKREPRRKTSADWRRSDDCAIRIDDDDVPRLLGMVEQQHDPWL
jgi:hypothetical protein